MNVTWKDKDYKNWQYPRPVPYEMLKLWHTTEVIRKKYPHIWRLGGTKTADRAYKILTKAVKRGYFDGTEKITMGNSKNAKENKRVYFIPQWQAWMARHAHDYRAAGVVAHLKWLSIPAIGWAAAYSVLLQEFSKPVSDFKPKKRNAKTKKTTR